MKLTFSQPFVFTFFPVYQVSASYKEVHFQVLLKETN